MTRIATGGGGRLSVSRCLVYEDGRHPEADDIEALTPRRDWESPRSPALAPACGGRAFMQSSGEH